MQLLRVLLGLLILGLNGCNTAPSATRLPATPDFSIPMLDLNDQQEIFVTVAREEGQYLGHPTAVLFADGKTMLAAFPTAHGKGDLRLRNSLDGGESWNSLDVDGIKLHEVPILYLVPLPNKTERVLMTTCKVKEGILQWTWSDDKGKSWVPMQEMKMEGANGVVVALASLWKVQDNKDDGLLWRGVFHDFDYENYSIDMLLEEDKLDPNGYLCQFKNLQRINYSSNEGRARAQNAGLCEAGVVRSPDGEQLALLMRPQHKKTNAMIVFSSDEGVTWSDPLELPGSLTGERHVACYAADGRLVICFRDYSPLNIGNPSHGDWVAWVGEWQDLKSGAEGQYRVRLKRNYGNSTNSNIGDCGYSAMSLLADGTLVCMTYGHWDLLSGSTHPNHPDGRGMAPYILSARLDMAQLDVWVQDPSKLLVKPLGVFAPEPSTALH